MKPLLFAATALAIVAAANLSPAMANRLGPFDTRLSDDSDRLGQNGVNAATTTPDGRHYEWQYHYGHEWEVVGGSEARRPLAVITYDDLLAWLDGRVTLLRSLAADQR